MQNTNKQNHTFEIVKNVWNNSNFLKYSGLTVFIIGIILCLIGLIQSYLSGINLRSPRDEISKVVIIVGIGLPLIFVGMNLALKPARGNMYLVVVGTALSLASVAIFNMYYVKNWHYPLVSLVWLIYIFGILSLIWSLFTNTTRKEIEIKDLKGELRNLSERLKLIAEKKPDDEFTVLKGKLNLSATKIQELQDDTQKLQRDFEDYGLRVREERRAHDKFVDKLLQIIDACEPFYEPKISEESEIGDKAAKRIKSIYNRLQDILEAEGISEMAVSIGGDFDPYKHEIVDGEDLSENVVIKEKKKTGYLCGSIVIRKASVSVENKKKISVNGKNPVS